MTDVPAEKPADDSAEKPAAGRHVTEQLVADLTHKHNEEVVKPHMDKDEEPSVYTGH